MRFRKLSYFVAVAEEQHFGRAAERLHIAQPPLSQQIRSLEESMGVTLFERSSQKVRLTRAGEAFLPQARALLQQWQRIQEEVRAVGRGEQGALSIGFVWAAGTPHFSDSLADFKRRFPKTSLNLEEMNTTDALEALRQDRLDMAFIIVSPGLDIRSYQSRYYETQKNVLALPATHPLCELATVPLSALNQEPFIVFSRPSHPALYDQLMSCLFQAGVQPDIVQVARLTQTTRTLVAAGVGVSIVPESTCFDERHGLTYRPLEGELPDLELHMVWKAERSSPLLEQLVEHMLPASLRERE